MIFVLSPKLLITAELTTKYLIPVFTNSRFIVDMLTEKGKSMLE